MSLRNDDIKVGAVIIIRERSIVGPARRVRYEIVEVDHKIKSFAVIRDSLKWWWDIESLRPHSGYGFILKILPAIVDEKAKRTQDKIRPS